MNEVFVTIVVSMGFAVAIGALFIAARLCIQYELTCSHLVIQWLGMPVRKIPLENIKSMGAQPTLCAEHWSNTLSVKGKRVVLRLHRGLFKNVVVTPCHPFVFRTQLERLRQAWLARQKTPVQAGDTEVYVSPAFPSDFSWHTSA